MRWVRGGRPLLHFRVGYCGGAARRGRADYQSDALRDERVERVQAFCRVALVVGLYKLYLTAENAAGCVYLFHSEVSAGNNAVAVCGKRAGVRGNDADDYLAVGITGVRASGSGTGTPCTAAGREAEHHAQYERQAQQRLSFHFIFLLFLFSLSVRGALILPHSRTSPIKTGKGARPLSLAPLRWSNYSTCCTKVNTCIW